MIHWIIRLPGFHHRKDVPYLVHEIPAGRSPVPLPLDQMDALLERLTPKPPQDISPRQDARNVIPVDTGSNERAGQAEVAEALACIDPDGGSYQDWLDVLMALHDEFGSAGLALAEDWSQRGPKYRPGDVASKFAGFTPGKGKTIAHVFGLAKSNGCDVAALRRKYRGGKSQDKPHRKATPAGWDTIELTDDGVALHFTHVHKDRLRFDHDAGKWYEWTGDHWRQDGTARGFHYCREAARRASVDSTDKEMATARKASFAAGVERMVKSHPIHAVRQDVWDQDPWIVGVPGAVVDLKDGRTRPADPNDLITKRLAIAPAPTQDCPRWLQFLDEATGGDDDLIRFLQQWCGYSLTGVTREHALVFMYGGGGNGKSVFLNTLSGILGDYATQASMDTFTASTPGPDHPSWRHGLRSREWIEARAEINELVREVREIERMISGGEM